MTLLRAKTIDGALDSLDLLMVTELAGRGRPVRPGAAARRNPAPPLASGICFPIRPKAVSQVPPGCSIESLSGRLYR
jgi:hypothetical protein